LFIDANLYKNLNWKKKSIKFLMFPLNLNGILISVG